MDPNGGNFMQEVVLEWRPQYCDKCQKIGHQCQLVVPTKEELPKKRRPWKKAEEQEQIAREANYYTTSEKSKQEIEQEQNKQTTGEMSQINLRPNAGGKHLDFNYTNFPILASIPTRNGFESLMHSNRASLPIDRGGAPKTF
ncbi:hypothetical protein KY284_020252 [Solanum tuberosum]|nr:hypothetical protein KY284_020252 [Solanum tuberosum]